MPEKTMSNCIILAWECSHSKTLKIQNNSYWNSNPFILHLFSFFHSSSIHFLHSRGMIEFLKLLKLPHTVCYVLFSPPHAWKCPTWKSSRYSAALFPSVCTQYPPSLSDAPSPRALSNQSPLSQAAPCWVLQWNNEHTVAEYFIQPAPSIPRLFVSRDRGPGAS